MNKLNLIVPLMYTIMIMMMSLMLWNNFHPTHLILMLIMYSLMICLNLSMLKKTFLFSIIVFLIMISGVLIIFLYFSSLISNEKVHLKISKKMTFMMIMLSYSVVLILNNKKMIQPINTSMETITLTQLQNDMFNNIKWIYLYPYNSMTSISVILLILTMFSIIKIISIKSINLRKIN
nr:TPA_asm: NADH dehydrogenase subunit 6 [Pseudomyrmex gracilis]